MTPSEFRKIREAACMTQAALALYLGITGNAGWRSVQNWEYGVRRIPGPVVQLMLRLQEATARKEGE